MGVLVRILLIWGICLWARACPPTVTAPSAVPFCADQKDEEGREVCHKGREARLLHLERGVEEGARGEGRRGSRGVGAGGCCFRDAVSINATAKLGETGRSRLHRLKAIEKEKRKKKARTYQEAQ